MKRASSKDDPQLLKRPLQCDVPVGKEPPVPSVTDDDSSRNSDDVAKRQRPTDAKLKATPSERTKTQTQKEKEKDDEIRRVMRDNGPLHVYFGRGKPITTNPGNERFRSIVGKNCSEYKRANNALKLEIKKRIVAEVKSNGSKFFFIEEMKGNASQDPAEVKKKVLDKTRRALIDTWRSRAKWWKWADPDQGKLSWSPYSNKDGTALEQMFRKDEDHRTEVPVSIRKEKYLVDVSSMIMHRVDAYGNKNFTDLRVDRLDPDKVMDHGGELNYVSEENNVQQDDSTVHSFDLSMSSVGIPDDEKKHKVKAKAGLVCWSWADPAIEQLLCSNYPTGDGEQLAWSHFSNEDGTALERMYQTNPLSLETVDVTVGEERHLVDVTWMEMHRAEPDVNNITYHVRRCPPDKEMDGREPICLSGDSDGQYDTSSSAKSSGSQSSGASGTSIRSCSQPTDGGGGGQINLYWSLGMAQRSKDERSLFAFEASDEDVLEEITAALEEERWSDGRSTGPPVPIATHVGTIGTIGVRRPGLVKLKKMVESQIGLSIGNKKDPMEAEPLSIGEKKAPTEIPRHKETSLRPVTKTHMSRHSIDAIVGAPPAVNDKKPSSLSSLDNVIDNLAGDPFRRHSLIRDPPRGKSPASIPAPFSVSNTASTPKHIQSEEGKHAPPAVMDKRPPTRVQLDENLAGGKSISRLIEESGTQHVYFGRGLPCAINPGNKRFRSIVGKNCSEYERANKTLRHEIQKRIVAEFMSIGSTFFFVNRNATLERAEVKKVLERTGQALREAVREAGKYRAYGSSYSNKDGTSLEQMHHKNLHRREEVQVAIEKQQHLVDVSSMIMHRVDAKGNKNFHNLLVQRLEPVEEMDSRELIDVSQESECKLSTSSSGSQSCGASGTTFDSPVKHDTKQSVVDTERKFDSMEVQEADDMHALTSTAETSMGLDDSLTLYGHKCRLKSVNTSKKSGQH